MICYRFKLCCLIKVSEGVIIFGVRWMIYGYLGVVFKRFYIENDIVLFILFIYNF